MPSFYKVKIIYSSLSYYKSYLHKLVREKKRGGKSNFLKRSCLFEKPNFCKLFEKEAKCLKAIWIKNTGNRFCQTVQRTQESI